MDCRRKSVSFQTKKGAVSFVAAATKGCPKPPSSARQRAVQAAFAEAARICAEPGKNPAKTARLCMPPRFREELESVPARGRLKEPSALNLDRYKLRKLTGCKADAQRRAEEFCQRFSYVSDAPELAGAACFASVRRVFARSGCGDG